MAEGADQPTPEKQFDLLSGALTKLFEGLISFAFRQHGFLLLVVGWLMPSESARAFVADELLARTAGTAIAILVTALHAGWAQNYYARAVRVMEAIDDLDYATPAMQASLLHVRLAMVRGSQLSHAALTLVIVGLLWLADGPPPP